MESWEQWFRGLWVESFLLCCTDEKAYPANRGRNSRAAEELLAWAEEWTLNSCGTSVKQLPSRLSANSREYFRKPIKYEVFRKGQEEISVSFCDTICSFPVFFFSSLYHTITFFRVHGPFSSRLQPANTRCEPRNILLFLFPCHQVVSKRKAAVIKVNWSQPVNNRSSKCSSQENHQASK